ncbi:5-methylcytosine restriction system specificity protein McrC [Bacillus toyonensis]|uniref:5-methylcytosine restriction system specificity protein McrC n=1 Tax=Bacillus toyonensis TaxID=155322 RepID=UPI003AA80602
MTVDKSEPDRLVKSVNKILVRNGHEPMTKDEILSNAKYIKTDNPTMEVKMSVDMSSYKKAIIKIIYKMTYYWLGERYLNDAMAIKIRDYILSDVLEVDGLFGKVDLVGGKKDGLAILADSDAHIAMLNTLRGKLELSKHIYKNVFQKTKAYCAFDEHTENNSLNQLFKCALLIVKKHTKVHTLRLYLESCLGYLEPVDVVHFSEKELKNITFNRQNERFCQTALFAKLIVERATIYSKGRGASSFSFLFQMNMLFEKIY